MIQIPDLDLDFLPIPDPWVKKAPDPRSGSPTLALLESPIPLFYEYSAFSPNWILCTDSSSTTAISLSSIIQWQCGKTKFFLRVCGIAGVPFRVFLYRTFHYFSFSNHKYSVFFWFLMGLVVLFSGQEGFSPSWAFQTLSRSTFKSSEPRRATDSMPFLWISVPER